MLFNSYIFVFIFLPVCIIGYFCLNHFEKYNSAKIFMIGMSLWFYGYFNVSYLAVIITSVLVNYLFYRILMEPRYERLKKIIFILALAFNLGMLIYFKYTDFFLETVNAICKTNIGLLHIVLPLGISFFTFQQISFIVDTYRGEVEKYHLIDYACYVTFFPQLIAGPIVTHDELIPQFRSLDKKRVNWDNLSKGLFMFSMGLVKKVVFADTFGNAVNIGYANVDTLNSTNAIIVMLSYTMQIYFDFSGYCDMAVGIGKMLNISLPVNFNSPYKALTIKEFWDRWHMTLTRFFTKYVYIPLGGNRKGNVRTYINIFIVFFLSGFWHGAGFTFIVWGIGHGIMSILYRRFQAFFDRLYPLLNWVMTFIFINVMWVFFRAVSIEDAFTLLKNIICCNFGPVNQEIVSAFRIPEMIIGCRIIFDRFSMDLAPFIFLAISLVIVLGCDNAYERMNRHRGNLKYAILTAMMLVWGVCSFTGVSTFLYYNF